MAKKLPEVQDLPVAHKLTIFGQGCLLGEEDLLSTRTQGYQTTCKCYSTKGVLFEIPKEEFLKLLQSDKSMDAVKAVVNLKNMHKAGHDIPTYLLKQSKDRKMDYSIKVDDISTLDP